MTKEEYEEIMNEAIEKLRNSPQDLRKLVEFSTRVVAACVEAGIKEHEDLPNFIRRLAK